MKKGMYNYFTNFIDVELSNYYTRDKVRVIYNISPVNYKNDTAIRLLDKSLSVIYYMELWGNKI